MSRVHKSFFSMLDFGDFLNKGGNKAGIIVHEFFFLETTMNIFRIVVFIDCCPFLCGYHIIKIIYVCLCKIP